MRGVDPGARARVAAVLLTHNPALAAVLAPMSAGELAELADALVRAVDPEDAALRAELAAGHPRWGHRLETDEAVGAAFVPRHHPFAAGGAA